MIITKGTIIYDGNKREYEVKEKIGGGGFSSVFEIEEIATGDEYALKTLPTDFENEKALLTFKNEMVKALNIKGKNVVEYRFLNDGGIYPNLPPYIIMEFCEGGTLKSYLEEIRIKGKNITNEEIKAIFLQLIEGMKVINSEIIHRDIKLENLLLKEGVIKISDFGISKNLFDTTRTITFKAYGTKEYTAPEAWKNEKNTIQMDIYSMGIVFYEIATLLNYPYKIEKNTMEEYRNAHLYKNITSPRKYNSSLDLTLEGIIVKMLEKEPNKRFKNWKEIEEKLETEIKSKNSELLNKMLKKRLKIDETNRELEIKRTKKLKELEEKKEIIKYSVYSNIFTPIRELIEDFNKSYSGEKIKYSEYNKSNDKNRIYIKTLSGKEITASIETIVGKKFEKINGNTFGEFIKEEYRPKINNREILAWGSIFFDKDKSYNLILVEDVDNMYGKWYLFGKKDSLNFYFNSDDERIIALSLDELEERTKLGGNFNYYEFLLKELNIKELLNFFEKYV